MTRLTVFVLVLAIALGGRTRFPESMKNLPSPDGRYVVCNIDSDVPPYHQLLLREVRSKRVTALHSYQRHVDAIWSPDSRSLAVTDHAGSNYSNVLIFFVGPQREAMDLREELSRGIQGAERTAIFDNHHVYINAVKWLSAEKLRIRVAGYGEANPNGFSFWYDYTLGSGFAKSFMKRK